MTNLPLPLILLGAGVAVLALVVYLIISAIVEASRKRWDRRINGHELAESGVLVRKAAPARPSWSDRFDAAFEGMIQRTGLDMTPAEALALMSILAVGLAGGLILWRDQLWLGIIGLTLGIGVPLVIFWIMQSRYRWQLQSQLPDAFYMLARAMRAGLSLEQALDLVAEQGTRPLSEEFKRCTGHIRLGLTVPAALQIMADRLRLLDFNAFVSAVAFQRTAGGNLALLLDRLASSTRDHNQFRGHLFAATAQARASAIFLAAAGPLLLLGYAIFQPTHVQAFFQSATGWMVLAGALTAEMIAAIVVFSILRIEY